MVDRQRAQADGARPKRGSFERAGGGLDVQIAIEKLHRAGVIGMDHIRVIKHYGKRGLRPDEHHPKEKRAAMLWDEVMEQLGAQLHKKGLVDKQY